MTRDRRFIILHYYLSLTFLGTFQPDLLASIVYLYPELVTEQESFCCTVELDGKYTRSMMIVDRLKRIGF